MCTELPGLNTRAARPPESFPLQEGLATDVCRFNANAALRQASSDRGHLTWIRLGAADARLVTSAQHDTSRIVA